MLARWAKRLLASIGFLWVLVTFTPLCAWWGDALTGRWSDGTGDILIVPGADTVGEFIGVASYWRSVYAVRAFHRGGFREIVLTGGARTGPPVAQLMRDFLVCQGIPEAAIRTEIRSESTHENALFTQELLAGVPGKKVLMSSDYHMFRATRAFRKAGLQAEPLPFPDALKRYGNIWDRWSVFQTLCLETVKIGYYFARGWI